MENGARIDLTKSNTKWPLKTKLLRGLWEITYFILFRPTPKRLGNRWRCWLLKLFGTEISGEALIMPSCRILQPWRLKVGNGVAIGRDVEIYNYDWVKIDSMSVVSQYSYLCTGTHDFTHPHMPLIWAPITIGSQCWIAARVFIAPGVNIGNGAVIGACSVVSKTMPSWTVCAGNPCNPLKPRVVKEI